MLPLQYHVGYACLWYCKYPRVKVLERHSSRWQSLYPSLLLDWYYVLGRTFCFWCLRCQKGMDEKTSRCCRRPQSYDVSWNQTSRAITAQTKLQPTDPCYSCNMWFLRFNSDVYCSHYGRCFSLSNDERNHCCYHCFTCVDFPWKEII